MESVEVDFDPGQLSYEELLDVFWTSHNPARRSWSRQYASAIFYHDEEQERQARDSKARMESALGRQVYTEILPYEGFTLAEDYHQKFRLRSHRSIAGEYRSIYPSPAAFVDSTAVTRVNGYLSGCASCMRLEGEIDLLGLSEGARRELLDAVCRR